MDAAAAQTQTPLASSAAVRRLVLGLLVVVLDLRVQGFDLLVDAVGWVVVVGALAHLARALTGLGIVRVVAAVAAPLSLADLLHPTRTTVEDPFGDGSMTTSTTTVVAPDGMQGDLASAYGAVWVVFLVLLCLAVARSARREGVVATASRFRGLAWTAAAVQGTGVVLGVVADLAPGLVSELGVLPLLLALGGFVISVLALVSLWRLRHWPLLLEPSDTGVYLA